ncbi:hypothetical protein [Arenimonas oryziterrae]|uniref:Uncharacterized protein n=1 Tax=Arenimonas oryziterrae DSM 21050 = YC6267 TaxID=1121015 RepID=A0A091APB1_9GAMM|nr:hypothetical protein [Arenimonas oryziterrae]KFN41226.1 hypothetical protein N789_04885 [Arenimonas oryziterrae DSM 21050 = YC6267]
MTRITFHRRAALALALVCGLLGLAIAAAAAMSQASPVAIGQSFGLLGAIAGLTAATLGIAWNHVSRQSVAP